MYDGVLFGKMCVCLWEVGVDMMMVETLENEYFTSKIRMHSCETYSVSDRELQCKILFSK